MNLIEIRKRTLFKKYHDSDIFNIQTDANINKSYRPPKYKTTQPSLEKTKSDIFNTNENKKITSQTKPIRLRRLNLKNYKSDIFNLKEPKKGKSCQRVNINHSTCFDGIKNNEEYKKDLSQYTKTHRPKIKEYEADKYLYKDTAIGRYYKELYGDEKNGIFWEKARLNKTMQNSPEKEKNRISIFKNNMKNFENRKKQLKKKLIEINDCGVDGKRKPGEHLGDSKGKNIKYNRRKIDLYGQNLDSKKLIQEKNYSTNNYKYSKQLEFQSNIFNDKNKDINKNLNEFINNKKKEQEDRKLLKEKIRKEREEMSKKISEQKKQNLKKDQSNWGGAHSKWQKSNMSWMDPGAQVLFKKTYTSEDITKEEKMTSFQRKVQDLSDSNNIDTLSGLKKVNNFNELKKVNNINDDDNNIEQLNEILNNIPENQMREDQKRFLISNSTTSKFLNESNKEAKFKKINKCSKNIMNTRLSKSKKKKDSIIKIMGKNSGLNKTFNNTNSNDKYNEYAGLNYTLVYPKRNQFDRFENQDIKKIFGNKGVHIYDVKKSELSVGDLNTIKFKVRETDFNDKSIEEKIKLVEDDLIKNKYKVSINKDKKKKITKDNRNPKQKEKEVKEVREIKANGKYIKTPYKPKGQKPFISLYPKVDLKYKNNYQNL